jgi:superfamily II DNA or RNA helicase
LGKYYDDLIIAARLRELIDGGFLSDFKVYAPSHPDLTKVRTVAGDFHEGDISKVMSAPELVADVVETWKAKGENRSTLCFAVDCAHAKLLQTKFEAAGVSAGYVDAHTDRAERKAIKDRFHSGELRVVCNVGVLTTGTDWDVRCIIMARPTKSEMLFVQIIGRGLRTAEGKDHCLIFDHTDTHLRLGFVDGIHHDVLDDGKPRKVKSASDERQEPLPKECPACSFLKPPKVHKCPESGFAPERQSKVGTVDGELLEFSEGTAKKFKKVDQQEKQRWFSMLLYIAGERGYKPGWAANQFKNKFGHWPDGLMRFAIPADQQVHNYVKYSQIRFAKRRKAA